MQPLQGKQLVDYGMLAARVLLAAVLAGYGWAKLSGNQFGITPEEMEMPVRKLDLFRLSWYLADHQPFKSFIGISQILTAVLLLHRRTLLAGLLFAIPIWLNILIWDITFMKFGAGELNPFIFRLSYYLLLTLLILWHYHVKNDSALKYITKVTAARVEFPWWAWLLLPVAVFVLELCWSIPRAVAYLFVK